MQELTADVAHWKAKAAKLEKEKKSTPCLLETAEYNKTFEKSNFKREYERANAPEYIEELVGPLRAFIKAYLRTQKLNEEDGDIFVEELLKEAIPFPGELLSKIQCTAQRLWTSDLKLPNGRPLYSILNEVIRKDSNDEGEILQHAAVLTKAINKMCVAGRDFKLPKAVPKSEMFPTDDCVYRGAVIPKEHLDFFSFGRKYRVPNFLATSFVRKVAEGFCKDASEGSTDDAVMWIVHVDPAGRYDANKLCKHANLIVNSKFLGEKEYLFVPYSVFTVSMVYLSPNPSYHTPHIIHLQAALDNKKEPESLPLAPWS
eukprot:m.60039 g.60039  ORF g.60039 m.60039 type:complete len:315 (-) comp11290_c0_seq1:79-1023(-)